MRRSLARPFIVALGIVSCLAVSLPAVSGPTIGTLYPSSAPGVNRRFELTFTLADIQPHGEVFPSDGNFGYNPFQPETTTSGPIQTAPGVKVWAEITAPDSSTFTLNGFWCVEYEFLGDTSSGYERIVPINHAQTGTAEHWHVRFIPTMVGLYSATVYADDPDPSSPPSTATTSFEVQGAQLADHGIVHVSDDGKALELSDGTPYCQLGFQMPQGSPPVADYPVLNGKKGLEILADAGGNFIRRWLVNTSREDIYRGISWHQGSGEQYDSTVARRGSRSKRITGSASTITAVDRSFLGCRPSHTYTGSIWFKASPGSIGRLRMRVNESNGSTTIERKSAWVSTSDLDWQQVSATFTTASDAKWLHFKPQLEAGSAGTFYLDDMDLRDTTPGLAVDWNAIQNPSFEQWTPIQLDVANLWRAEYCLRKCEQLGIKAQLTLFDYRLWNTSSPIGFYYNWYGDSFWGAMASGAWLETESVKQEKRILRYVTARYGGYPSFGFWELTNEMSPDFAEVAYQWQRNTSEYIQSIDLGYGGLPNQRPVTNSYWSSPADTVAYEQIPHMQVSSAHSYMYTNTKPDLSNRVPGWSIDGSRIDGTSFQSPPTAYHAALDYGSEVGEDALIARTFGTRPNTHYRLGYRLKIGSMTGTDPKVRVACYRHDALGVDIASHELKTLPPTDWAYHEIVWFTAPDDADVAVQFGLMNTRSLELWFDDMELRESEDGINWRQMVYNSNCTITDFGDDELIWVLFNTGKFQSFFVAGPNGYDKAWISGESGLFDWSTTSTSWVFSQYANADTTGIHSHNMVWAQVMATEALNSPCYWFSYEYMVAKAAAGIDVYTPTWKGVSEFLKALPFRTGSQLICTESFFSEVLGVTSTNPSIRLVGRKKENSAYFWVSNLTNTWANRIQRGNTAVPISATLSIPGFAPGSTLSNYDSYTGALLSTQTVSIAGSGVLRVQVADLATDTAFIVTPEAPQKLHPIFLPDGASVEVPDAVVVSDSYDEPGVYVEVPSRAWGVKVIPPVCVLTLRGDQYSIKGTMRTDDGRRCIEIPPDGEFELISVGLPPKPVAVVASKQLGGTAPGQYAPKLKDGIGLYNVGLLVTCFGNVTDVGDGFFYIDDGCLLRDGSGYAGIRVETSEIPAWLDIGHYVIVTGISSTAVVADQVVRCLRPRNSSDMTDCPP